MKQGRMSEKMKMKWLNKVSECNTIKEVDSIQMEAIGDVTFCNPTFFEEFLRACDYRIDEIKFEESK